MQLVTPRDAVSTYRHLRVAVPLLVVLLAAAVIGQILVTEPDCWLGSISAYYYTSARAVFVACLCAMGACLIIHQGNGPWEDLVLNLSGFAAFVVALVPTPLDDLVIRPGEVVNEVPVCARSNVPTDAQLIAAVDNNVLALLIAATACLVVALILRAATGQPNLTVALLIMGAAVLLAWLLFGGAREWVRGHAHLGAAMGMFGGIVLVVMMNGFSQQAVPRSIRNSYRAIFGMMLSVILVAGFMAWRQLFEHTVFWLEAALIVLFGVFWVVQTKELWNYTTRGSGETALPTHHGAASRLVPTSGASGGHHQQSQS